MAITPEQRRASLDAYRTQDISKVAAILAASLHQETWDDVAERIVDELNPPYWRMKK